jgi:RNA polymerase subunit RPABC4/transcription elongation factor Spt4
MSHIAMEKHICPVCGEEHSHNTAILIHRGLRDIGEVSPSGFSLCEEHMKLVERGYINLVVVDPEKSIPSESGSLKPEGAYLTGQTVAIQREVFSQLVEQEFEDVPFAYIDPDLFNLIVEMNQRGAEQHGTH